MNGCADNSEKQSAKSQRRPKKMYENPVIAGRVLWLSQMGISRKVIKINQLDRPMSNLAFAALTSAVTKRWAS